MLLDLAHYTSAQASLESSVLLNCNCRSFTDLSDLSNKVRRLPACVCCSHRPFDMHGRS
jgi:hypothetical protein